MELMGGEEYGFGSVAMIAEGCIMARIYPSLPTTGCCRSEEELRQRFSGILTRS